MRLIDGDKLLRRITNYPTLSKIVKEQPTVDAVQVVRCKDCKYYDKFDGFGLCTVSNDIDSWQYDDFCSYGERRDGD